MMRKFLTLLAAFAVVAGALAPMSAQAQHRRGGYYDGRDRHYDHHRRYRDDDNDALAAGVVGLVLGLAVGSLASQPDRRGYACQDNYQRCAPPPRQDYYQQRYDEPPPRIYRDADEGYDDQQCTERVWDNYAQRYVYADVPC